MLNGNVDYRLKLIEHIEITTCKYDQPYTIEQWIE